jgi:fructose transport system ATP-binding protein
MSTPSTQTPEARVSEDRTTSTPAQPAAQEVVMRGRGLTKAYGHVHALDASDFDLRAGEVLAVIGDNGAGKSTLIKSLTGAVVPDSGVLELGGEVVRFSNPLDARKLGIETVYQELAVSPVLDIAANLFLGRELRKKGILGSVLRMSDRAEMRAQARDHMDRLGIRVSSVTQKVETLSGGQRQAVAVARAAAWGKRVVVLDEPTAALGVRETGQVLELVRKVRDSGLSVVLISHNIPDVFAVSDRIHIHRLGRRIALVETSATNAEDVVAVMTGARDPSTLPLLAELDGQAKEELVKAEEGS